MAMCRALTAHTLAACGVFAGTGRRQPSSLTKSASASASPAGRRGGCTRR